MINFIAGFITGEIVMCLLCLWWAIDSMKPTK